MAETAGSTTARDVASGGAPAGNGNGRGARPLARRRPLPGGRAVAGAFLIALALVGSFAGYTQATADTRESYLVAARELRIGQTITRRDLTFAAMDLPAGVLGGRVYRDPARLVGAVVLGPVARGELIQASAVIAKAGRPGDFEISVPIEAARAVGGTLAPGDFVDVAATFGTGEAAFTVYVVRHARVIGRAQSKGALGGSTGDVVTLAVASAEDALAVSHAFTAGQVSLVRSSGTPAPTGPAEPYRAPASREAGGQG